jgi:rhodanese-related sulfurtransferase
MEHVNNLQWKEKIAADENAVILDVRTPVEWNDGIIPHAQQIDVLSTHSFMEAARSLDKNKHYYVYCRSGMRSMNACQILGQLGIQKTYNLLGGIQKWDGEVVLPSQ